MKINIITRRFIKSCLVVATLTLSVQTFATSAVVSNTALNYSADQSVQPIATHTPLNKATHTQSTAHHKAQHRIKKSERLHHPKHKIHHRASHQKSQ